MKDLVHKQTAQLLVDYMLLRLRLQGMCVISRLHALASLYGMCVELRRPKFGSSLG